MDRDRFQLNEFAGLQSQVRLLTNIEQQQLGSLLRRSELTYVSSKGIDRSQLLAIPLQIHLANSTSANVGRTLLDLELELRRTASYLEHGAIRPSRNSEIVEMISARHVDSIKLVVAAAMEIYSLLTSRPIDFLLLLDWFWSRRHSHTKVRPPYEDTHSTRPWAEMIAMAKSCIESGRPVVVSMTIKADGSTEFGFRSP